jgi:AAA domain
MLDPKDGTRDYDAEKYRRGGMTTRNRGNTKTERAGVSTSDFAAEIVSLSESAESINALVYGDSNVGKTWLGGTAPGRTFWLVCEPGYKSASRRGATGHGRRVSDSATALAAVEWLYERDRYKKLDWLILDGLSTMQDRFRLAYTAEAFDQSADQPKRARAHRNLPDKPDYFNTQNFLKSWIPQLVDLPVNLLITAHAYRTDRTEDGELLVFPGIQGKISETSNAISGLMDFTGYYTSRRMKTKEGSKLVRRLWFDQPTEQWGGEGVRYVVGDKFDCLGPYMDFPTLPKILSKINGEEA